MSAAAHPAAESERFPALDILRGGALWAMVLVHFHQNMRTEAVGSEGLISSFVYVFVEEKAWGVFALLFGAGFALMMRSMESRGEAVVPCFLRRMAALALFGMLAQVLFGFEILFEYAVWGVALLLVRNWPTKWLVGLACLAAMQQGVRHEIAGLYAYWNGLPEPASPGAAFRAAHAAIDAAKESGSYLHLIAGRWYLFAHNRFWSNLLPQSSFVLFLIGLLAVRHGLVQKPLEHKRAIATASAIGLTSWLIAWTLLPRIPALPTQAIDWPVRYGMGLINEQWLSLTYAGVALLLFAKWPVLLQKLSLFGASGRMALTNYMLQAMIIDLMGSGYAGHIQMRPYVYLPASIAFSIALALLSRSWLKSHRNGPLEWVWRAVTFWHWPEQTPALRAAAANRG